MKRKRQGENAPIIAPTTEDAVYEQIFDALKDRLKKELENPDYVKSELSPCSQNTPASSPYVAYEIPLDLPSEAQLPQDHLPPKIITASPDNIVPPSTPLTQIPCTARGSQSPAPGGYGRPEVLMLPSRQATTMPRIRRRSFGIMDKCLLPFSPVGSVPSKLSFLENPLSLTPPKSAMPHSPKRPPSPSSTQESYTPLIPYTSELEQQYQSLKLNDDSGFMHEEYDDIEPPPPPTTPFGIQMAPALPSGPRPRLYQVQKG